jgi:hypothetical protein
MKLPKYVRIRNNTLFYQRDFPQSFRRKYGTKTYSRTLKLKASQHTEAELQAAVADATESFELHKKMYSNTTPEVFTDTELDKAAAEWIEKKGYRHGEFSDDQAWQEYAYDIEPELDEANDAWKTEEVFYNREEPVYTTRQEVMRRAYKALTSHTVRKPVLISDAWASYISIKKIDITSDAGKGKTEQGRHLRVLACIGNIPLTLPNSNMLIRSGLNRYLLENKEHRTPQAIKREVRKTVAAINYALKNLGAGWKLDNIYSDIGDAPSKKKKVFEKAHRIQIVLRALQERKKPHLGAMVVLMTQTGAMFSEIQRLNPKEVQKHLSGDTPVILFGGDDVIAKTEERRRIVPIVFGADYLSRHIPETIKYLNAGKSPTTNASTALKKYLNETLHTEGYTAHCFRHTLQAMGVAKNINGRHMASICGWSGKDAGLSKHALRYGAEYLQQDEGLLQVKESALKLQEETIAAIEQHSDPNIIVLSERQN